MSVSKVFLSEKLIEGYVKTPPSLLEQALNQLAIYICQLFPLKQDIICASDALSEERNAGNESSCNTWENRIESQSKPICDALPLAPRFRSELIVRIRWTALELFSWNKKHQAIFHTSAWDTDQFLTESDWTAEGRLDEAKIAERLVQDEKIPVCGRYRLACIHYIRPFILPLWDQSTAEEREEFCASNNLGNGKMSKLVKLISFHLTGRLHELELNGGENLLWRHQLEESTEEGARTAFVNIWKTLKENQKREVLIPVAINVLSHNIAHSRRTVWMCKLIENRYHRQLARPEHLGDILYFLLSHMSQGQRLLFFQRVMRIFPELSAPDYYYDRELNDRLFSCFLQWPYQDFFIPVVTKLWGILSEDRYANQLLVLAYRYARHVESKREKRDYAYGCLLVELLEHSPAQYKRYVFSPVTPDLSIPWGNKILLELLKKSPPREHKDKTIFRRFLRQATVEERDSIMYSQFGDKLCSRLIYTDSLEFLECIISECLTTERMALFKNMFFSSDRGKGLYLWLRQQKGESAANRFLNWRSLSEEQMTAFQFNVFFRNQVTFSGQLGYL